MCQAHKGGCANERLAEYIMSHDGVQVHTFNEIADDFLANDPRE